MLGDLTAKVLVILAGLIACGACAAALMEPAVEEAEEENVFGGADAGRDPLLDGDPAVVGPGGTVVADRAVVGANVVGPAVEEPAAVVIPGVVVWATILVALVLTGWAVVTPAAKLARPALIAGLCVLVGTLLAWGLGLAGASDYPLNGTALAAWLSVAFSLLAAWLIVAVLSTPGVNEAVPA